MTTCMVGNVPVKLQNIVSNKSVPSILQFAPYDCLLEKEIQLTTGYLPGMFAKPRSTKRTALCAGSASGVTDPCLYYAQTAQQAVAISAHSVAPFKIYRMVWVIFYRFVGRTKM